MSAIPDLYDYDPDPATELADSEQRERFRVDTDEKASWALRKLAHIRARKASNELIAEAERDRINAWLTAVNHPLDTDEQFFEGLLADYGRMQRDAEGRKTVSLPYGEIKTRETKAKVIVTDADTVLAWAKTAHPEIVKVTERVGLTELAKAVVNDNLTAVDPATGEVVPGTAITPAHVTVTVATQEGGTR